MEDKRPEHRKRHHNPVQNLPESKPPISEANPKLAAGRHKTTMECASVKQVSKTTISRQGAPGQGEDNRQTASKNKGTEDGASETNLPRPSLATAHLTKETQTHIVHNKVNKMPLDEMVKRTAY